MPLNVVSNYAANVAHRNLQMNDTAASSSLAKLSIGRRIVSARDDAASLAIGQRLNAEVMGLKQAVVNSGQANSMLQIADGAMSTTSDILTRMKVLAIQSS
ncbi:MAG: flagellin, partial [Alphaproteobacteria bacterium]|nr:flagellin [Alphaproteobacteria bacterium]